MERRSTPLGWVPHLVLWIGIAIVAFPIYVTFIASTHTIDEIVAAPMSLLPGHEFIRNYVGTLMSGETRYSKAAVGPMMLNSLVMALTISIGKIAISILSAYAVVFFRFRGRMICFWLIFVTLMLPVEVRILPTYQVAANLHLINSYTGLALPLIASATATLLFRQFFMTLPDELIEAARIDGAGPIRFFKDVVLPLSATNMAALFVILFVYGWNQYLWPLLVTNDVKMTTVVIGIRAMLGGGDAQTPWHTVMTTAILAMVPPTIVVLLMQRWFVKGLVDSEK